MRNAGLVSFFYIKLPSLTSFWDHSLKMLSSFLQCVFCQKPDVHKCVDACVDLPLYSTDECVYLYANTILSKWDISHPCLQGSGIYVDEEAERSPQKNSIFQTQQKDAEIVTCTRPTQGQSRHIPTWRRGSGHDMPPVDEELLVFDCYLDSKSQVSFIKWHLVYQPYSRAGVIPRNSYQNQTGFAVLFSC